MNPSITFLVCLLIIIAWFSGKYWERNNHNHLKDWETACIPVTIIGSIATFGCLIGSLAKFLILSWPK